MTGKLRESQVNLKSTSPSPLHLTTAGRKHLYLKPFVLDSFLERVSDKTRLITADGILSYLHGHFIKGFSDELIREMVEEIDFEHNGFITDKDVTKAATGLFKKRRGHLPFWQKILSVVTGEKSIYLDPKTGYEIETQEDHLAEFGHVHATGGRDASFPRPSTTALRVSESLAHSLRASRTSGGATSSLMRTSHGVRDLTLSAHEVNMQRHMEQTQQVRGKGVPFIGFDIKSEFMLLTGREKLRDQLGRSRTRPASARATTESSRGTGDFLRYFRPLGASALDNRRPFGLKYDMRSFCEAERDAVRKAEAESLERFATMQL